MENPWSSLFKDGALLRFAVFIIPGFIAWKIYQMRRPQGAQKPTDAIVEITAAGVVNTLVWSFRYPPQHWVTWPADWREISVLGLQLVASPVILALLFSRFVDFCASRGWILWPHPTAWDWIFNKLTPQNAYAMILTLNDGRKVAGAFINTGFVGLYPYEKDILLGEAWILDAEGRFAERVEASCGLYVEKKDVLTIELFDYNEVIANVIARAEGEKANG